MGNTQQRDFQCRESQCEGEIQRGGGEERFLSYFIFHDPGPATALSLLNVVSLTTGPDGSIFVGDYNLIRKIDPRGNVFTILEFRWVIQLGFMSPRLGFVHFYDG